MPRRVSHRTRSAKQRFRIWQRRYHNAEMVHQAEVLPLRRDMVTLLTFARDNSPHYTSQKTIDKNSNLT